MNNEKFKIYSIEEVISEMENCEYIDCTKGSGYFDNNQYENILYYLKQYQISQERINKAIEYLHENCEIELGKLCNYGDNLDPRHLEKILKGEKNENNN